MPVRMYNSYIYTAHKITEKKRGYGDGDGFFTAWILACMPAGNFPIDPLGGEEDAPGDLDAKAGPCDLAAETPVDGDEVPAEWLPD